MALKQGVGCAMFGVAYPLMAILGLVLHIWTVVMAFAVSGLFGAILSLMLPGLSQIYWGIAAWRATGTPVNPYCVAVGGYVLLWVVVMIGVAIADSEA